MSAADDPQTAFVRAILSATPSAELRAVSDGVSVERGLAAYRNNVRVLAGAALLATFPRVQEELGEADFSAMAWSFWRRHPPALGDLGEWGQMLPDFLVAEAGEASGLPLLARLDWACHCAERAADVTLDADTLALLGSESLETVVLRLRPAVQRVGEHHLVWREGWKAHSQALPLRQAAFFDALLAGVSLDAALNASGVKGLAPEPDFDFSAWLQDALRHEWLHEVVQLPR